MATSGSYLTSQVHNAYVGDGCPDRANISWSAEWNPSTLQWAVNWSANGAGWTNNYYVTIFSGTVTITDAGGNVLQTKSMSGQIAQARKDVQLVSGSFNVGIDTLGNSSINFSATFRIGVNGPSGESTGSQSFTLDAKPQGSIISSFTSPVSVGSSGGACAVSITRYSSSYTHDVTWTFGSYSYTATGVGTSTSYTIPASWLNAIPNSANGTGTVTVVTKSGGTQVGNAATAQFTISANVNPTIGSVTVAPRGTAYSAGITTVYIAGYSTALITASSVSGVQGSTISKVEFLRDGTVISSNTTRTYSYTTGTLNGSSATFSVRVTDSRGKQATASASAITIKAYATPSFSAASAYRCNSSGTAQNDGTYIRVTATAVATPTENSITALTYATKATTSSTWSNEANIGSGVIAGGFANTTSYDVRITATDKLGQSSYRYFTIPTAEYTMDFKVGGKGVAFGKVAETDNLVDSAWGIRSADYIEADNGMVCKTSTAYGNLNFQKTTDASRGLSVSTVTWGNSNQMYFNEFHRANDVNSSYVDQYWLPESGTDNSNHTYNILTTKGAGKLTGLTSSHTIQASEMYAIPIGNYCRIVEVNAVITLTSAVSNGSKILNGIPVPLTGAGWYFKPLHGSNTAGTGYELKYGADSGDTYGNVQSAQNISSGAQVRMRFIYLARP